MHEVERVVERVIHTIHENYGEQLTIDDMARTAMYSKFHFTRIFQRVTGITPGRFLSAVRLQKAKQLLTATSLKVTDISHMVGYASVGTFSSRFGYNVGVPPSTYRKLSGYRPWDFDDDHHGVGSHRVAVERWSTIGGNISFLHPDHEGPAFIGLFPERIPQGLPTRCTISHRPGPYVLEDVPPGTWYVIACSPYTNQQVEAAANGHAPLAAERALVAGGHLPFAEQSLTVGVNGPIVVPPGGVRLADVRLRPLGVLDPPVLLALPEMRPEALAAREARAA